MTITPQLTRKAPFDLILVHGTKFPPGPWLYAARNLLITLRRGLRKPDGVGADFPWTDPHEPGSFAAALKERYQGNVSITSPQWDGWNSQKARDDAAATVANLLSKGRPKVVVAHSHGGNVVIRALQRTATQSNVHGVVCLGTPFFNPIPRDPHAIAWLRAIGAKALLFLVVYGGMCAFASTVVGLWGVRQLLRGSPVMPLWMALMLVFGSFIGAYGLLLVYREFVNKADLHLKKVRAKQDEILARERWLEPIEPPCLCVHPTGDEAAGWLGFCTHLVSLPYALGHWLIGLPVIVGGAILAFIALVRALEWQDGGSKLQWVLALPVCAGTAFFAYWALANLLQLVSSLVFRLPLTIGRGNEHLIRTAVSLVPYGATRHRFVACSCERSLRHSAYDDPQVRRIVMEWIDQLTSW